MIKIARDLVGWDRYIEAIKLLARVATIQNTLNYLLRNTNILQNSNHQKEICALYCTD